MAARVQQHQQNKRCGNARQRNQQPKAETAAARGAVALDGDSEQDFGGFHTAEQENPTELFERVAVGFEHGHDGDQGEADQRKFEYAGSSEQQPVAAGGGVGWHGENGVVTGNMCAGCFFGVRRFAEQAAVLEWVWRRYAMFCR